MRTALVLIACVLPAVLMAPAHCLAQAMGDAGAGTSGGSGYGGHHGRRNQQNTTDTSRPPLIDLPKLEPDPRQRLDPGALLCGTEAELRQHQAAVMARIAGGYAPEPAGCHRVPEMIAVSVLGRDGPARTQVHLKGSAVQEGWTDSMVPDDQSSAR